MAKKTYDVHRSMHGDGRDYEPGDTRELDEADAAALVEMGALSPKGQKPSIRDDAVRHTFGKAETTGHIASTTTMTDKQAPATDAQPAPTAAQPVAARGKR